MRQKAIYPKVSVDMFAMQGMWASVFLAIMIIVQIIRTVIFYFTNGNLGTFFLTTFIASSIFMLVIGIIATYAFMPHFVGNGVTRKDFYRGTSLGAIGLSIVIPIVTYIISLIEKGIVTLIKLPIQYESVIEADANEDPSFIDKLFSLIFTSSTIDFNSHWVSVMVIFAISLLTFYLIGWLIGSAFYKHTILGFVAIALGVLILYLMGHIVAMLLGAPVQIFANTIELPMFLSIILLVAILAFCFYAIRAITRKAVIKI